MTRQLLQILPTLVHRPEVHRAVAIAQEVDTTVPPHSVFARSRVVRGQRDGLAARCETPDILRRSTLVAFGLAALKGQAGEKKCLVRILEDALRCLAEWNQCDE